jgi:hypothetical protein
MRCTARLTTGTILGAVAEVLEYWGYVLSPLQKLGEVSFTEDGCRGPAAGTSREGKDSFKILLLHFCSVYGSHGANR